MREERKAESAQLEAWSGCLDDVAQSIACIADGMELTWSDLTGWPGQATQYLFHHALAALGSAPAEAAEPVDARLESLWRQLALDGPARLRPDVAGAVRTLWPDAAHQQAYGHALTHLARLLAAGGCAWAALRSGPRPRAAGALGAASRGAVRRNRCRA